MNVNECCPSCGEPSDPVIGFHCTNCRLTFLLEAKLQQRVFCICWSCGIDLVTQRSLCDDCLYIDRGYAKNRAERWDFYVGQIDP